ncbi:NEDD8-conjugating enzyme ubc12 [Schizosaccharomyces pombe]|uniref:NEDD8-conjugating enzyme ubc12 n=1 Tax=Schizosaccharomyces pombe (strain 972 / ATCC 24843) TaxID=284812 RepID=UBC12_SCHPO|nr:NEDD8-conjugating enzyme Ubc12 [Schizosaccharomyces pombe]O74549.1 RecName: Full=NEDD8-conjugating enzyme ubc12; AltName: Full=RUB1-conjugating enzyme; AltName: Full=Ubiquitin carrier protein 12 [Schizosaccharomyces pombe 972h-]CAA20714.1 NEDD8-conjugating enzyme Ubc12 [Schizosaccharomyces pombe]|eukprot:NP_588256.1 NEDD8-conjugating enzyme Ubc12 [Schizosaccharomyces pombe]
MRKIWELKKKEAQKEKNASGISPAQIRIQKDVTDLEIPSTMSTSWPDPIKLNVLHLEIRPDEGYYKGGKFKFRIQIDDNYPHDPPKVKCLNKIYHPNIDIEGNVCLNILRQDWNPVLNLNSILVGLQFLFLSPNAEDPLNKEAAADLHKDPQGFASRVRTAMKGGLVNGISFDNVMA